MRIRYQCVMGRGSGDLASVLSADCSEEAIAALDAGIGKAAPVFTPETAMPAVRFNGSARRRTISMISWGLRRSDVKLARPFVSLGEATRDPYLVRALEERRCLIPIQEFLGWVELDGVAVAGGEELRVGIPGGSLIWLAGLWTSFKRASGEVERSLAVVSPNDIPTEGVVVPGMIAFGDHGAWLGEVRTDAGDILAMVQPST